jgi:hypothetical protein
MEIVRKLNVEEEEEWEELGSKRELNRCVVHIWFQELTGASTPQNMHTIKYETNYT